VRAFRFRLERVLTWRENELSLAEAKAEQLSNSLIATERALSLALASRTDVQAKVTRDPTLTGAELRALEMARVWAVREEKRLTSRVLELQRSIVEHQRHLAEARRAVKLVERLKERQHGKWRAEADHEVEELAGESAIAQWRRLHD